MPREKTIYSPSLLKKKKKKKGISHFKATNLTMKLQKNTTLKQ